MSGKSSRTGKAKKKTRGRRAAWTPRQDAVLRAYCYQGAKAVQKALVKQCNSYRTLHAIEVRASRIHASLAILGECSNCGAVRVRINKLSGMCYRCTEEEHVAEEQAFNELLELEAAGCDGGAAYERAQKEYARLRQANSRLRRKYGLAGKAERDKGMT